MKAFLPAVFLALTATLVLAHSGLDVTVPENGAELTDAPTHIVLSFTRSIRLTRVRMTHDENETVDLDLGGQTVFATRFVLPLFDMGRGVYRIEWRGLSADGHAMRNEISFKVK